MANRAACLRGEQGILSSKPYARALRVLLKMGSMCDPPEEKGSECDVDHGVGDVEALLIVSDEAAPSCHPAEGSFDDPAPWKDVEALGSFDPSDDFDDES